VGERLRRADARRGFLLDGYPRNPAQAQTLTAMLAADGVDLDAVLLLVAPDPVLVERVRERGRHDDREDVVAQRLRIFREQTEPLIAFYRQRGLLRELDGDRPREAVTADIVAALGAEA
jgi:adenylate kinase